VVIVVDEKQKEVQEKVLVYQILQNQLEEFTKQATVLETRLNELEITENSLKEMKGVKEDSETMFHIGSGCYGHGKLLDKNKFMIEIGAGIMANKPLPEALSVIEARKKEVENVKKKLELEMEKIGNSMNQIGVELQQLSDKAKGNAGDAERKADDDITIG
jgi:prefoldin alpha subunit